jgi:hypothetical protein
MFEDKHFILQKKLLFMKEEMFLIKWMWIAINVGKHGSIHMNQQSDWAAKDCACLWLYHHQDKKIF